ncbi:AroM family protein [Candidatus Bathyarchaeota archaeon]|nr:MAG: AroM family protein [Candidatus Bathyarchaeota archaeon]
MKKIGMLTIGQAPRGDILPPLMEILGDGFEIVEAGALDDVTSEEIDQIEFEPDDYLLVSRMRDGTEVMITKRFILPRLQEKLRRLDEQGVGLTVIMCTGRFPKFESKGLVVTPQEILKGVLEATLKRGRLGVVYPAEEQTHMAETTFGREGVEVYADFLSPYDGESDVEALADRLTDQDLDLILLNCFGFDSNVKATVAERTSRPVILSNTLVARVLKELA